MDTDTSLVDPLVRLPLVDDTDDELAEDVPRGTAVPVRSPPDGAVRCGGGTRFAGGGGGEYDELESPPELVEPPDDPDELDDPEDPPEEDDEDDEDEDEDELEPPEGADPRGTA